MAAVGHPWVGEVLILVVLVWPAGRAVAARGERATAEGGRGAQAEVGAWWGRCLEVQPGGQARRREKEHARNRTSRLQLRSVPA